MSRIQIRKLRSSELTPIVCALVFLMVFAGTIVAGNPLTDPRPSLDLKSTAASTVASPVGTPLPHRAANNSTTGGSCRSASASGNLPQLVPSICVRPSTLCRAGSTMCKNVSSNATVRLWVNATGHSYTVLPYMQVVFVVETTPYDGAYDPSETDTGGNPCNAPCLESNGDPYFVANAGEIATQITLKNTGLTSSPRVTFSMVDFFSTQGQDHDDGDGNEYNVDVSTFQPADAFATTVDNLASGDALFGFLWNDQTMVLGDSDFSDNFLDSSMITALYGTLNSAGLSAWKDNASTSHVIVWMGSTMPRDPNFRGDWCVTYNDYATACPNPTAASEPSYSLPGGITSPAGENMSDIVALARSKNVVIDVIDLPDGMTVLNAGDYKTTNATAKNDVDKILSAGCYLAEQTGGTWEGPTPANTGINFTCPAAATGAGDGNLTDTSRAAGWSWTSNPALGWALSNVKFPSNSSNVTAYGTVGLTFQFVPGLGFNISTGAISFQCSRNGTNISALCAAASAFPVSGGIGWGWPYPEMLLNDSWSATFNVTATSTFPNTLLGLPVPIDECVNGTWSGCGGGIPYSEVKYTNYVGVAVNQSFPPVDVKVTGGVGPLSIQSFTASPNPVMVGNSSTFSVAVAGGIPPYTYSYSGLPAGCSPTNTSVQICTPSTPGNYSVMVSVVDIGHNNTSATTTLTVTGTPSLTSISISPASATIFSGGKVNLTATPSCSTGFCPPGITYSWSLNNTLGSLNVTAGADVTFTAGSTSGAAMVTVMATLSGKLVSTSSTIRVTSPASSIESVAISPTSETLTVGEAGTFTAMATCSGPCPSSVTYSWTLTTPSMGNLNDSTGDPITFIAGNATGDVTLFVNATLDGVTRQSAGVPITITSAGGPTVASFTASPASIPLGGTTYLNVTVTGGSPPYNYAYSLLPSGCSSADTARLTCTPSVAGTYTILATVTDASSRTTSAKVTFNVISGTGGVDIKSFTASPSSVTVGQATVLNVLVIGGTPPLTYTYTGLPEGCQSSDSTSLRCTPAAPGNYTVQVYVNDSAGHSVTALAKLTVTDKGSSKGPSSTTVMGVQATIAYVLIVAVIASIGIAGALMLRRKREPTDPQLEQKATTGVVPRTNPLPPKPPE